MSLSRYLSIGATLAALISGATAIAASGAAAATARPASAVVIKLQNVKIAVGSSSKSHKVLVSASGRPIYLLTGDSSKSPKCKSSSCLATWPAVTSKSMTPKAGPGVKGRLGIWKHAGMQQVTLNGHPLYMYAADSSGSSNGEGLKSFGGVWEVFSGNGSALTLAALSGGSGSGGSTGTSTDSGWS